MLSTDETVVEDVIFLNTLNNLNEEKMNSYNFSNAPSLWIYRDFCF